MKSKKFRLEICIDTFSIKDFLDYEDSHQPIFKEYKVIKGFRNKKEAISAWTLLGREIKLIDMTKKKYEGS